MDHFQIDRISRALFSRRATLAGIAGLGLTLLGRSGAEAHNPAPACRKLADAKRRRACLKRARAHNRKHRQSKPDASCNGQPTGVVMILPEERLAQTFTATKAGPLREVTLFFNRSTGGSGDFLLQVNAVDQASGVPTSSTIASAFVTGNLVSTAFDFVRFTFATPATLVAGRQYAVVLSLPSGTGSYSLQVQDPGACGGGAAYFSFGLTGAFSPVGKQGADFAYLASKVNP